ncbi:transglutaminase-like cysteine peptidase [Alkalimarinus sediminis]|uniref:Transglutaminase-like cysteine peptidase n=2 Tax=Alkalimarinus sediminis TaxID=1632866 RepID=A0A9E8KRD1_9ALTE|nr:transglutaminase-like cysteine peptidase [Alkalimarinus sediminis]UZW76220.1 transglutaminase-like cysteine peptidase [Alkalimarinus sediminis]
MYLSQANQHYFRNALILAFSFSVSMLYAFELSDKLLGYIESKYGQSARSRLELWQRLATTPSQLSTEDKLNQVNRFFNTTQFKSDLQHWGQEDYWATPVELLATNGGDCEDYSIAKYFTLKTMGVPVDKLRITYVKAIRLNQAHMVLAYYETPSSEPLILDNLISDIKPASKRTDLVPVYSFNGDGLWLSKQRGQGKRIGEAGKLSRWVDLNTRLLDDLK